MEAVSFLETLVRALGRGWSAKFGMSAVYGVYGVTLTSDVGGTIEVVPALVRGPAVIWSPFVFTRGTPIYELFASGKLMLRTPSAADAVARLERWRAARGPQGKVAARLSRIGSGTRRTARTTEIDLAPGDTLTDIRRVLPEPLPPPAPRGKPAPAGESLADALRDARPGKIERARKLARHLDHTQACRELSALARHATGDARANALGVLAAIAGAAEGGEFARYLDDPERSVQLVAIDGVKRTGHAAAVPALAQLVLGRDGKPTSGKTQLAFAAAAAMKALSGKRGSAALTGYFAAGDPRVREAACVALAMAGSLTKPTRIVVERLLADDDARVVKAAKRALAG